MALFGLLYIANWLISIVVIIYPLFDIKDVCYQE